MKREKISRSKKNNSQKTFSLLTEHYGHPGSHGSACVRRVDGFGDLPLQQQRAKGRRDGNGGVGSSSSSSSSSSVVAASTSTSTSTTSNHLLPPPFGVGPAHDHDRVLAVRLEHDDGRARRRRRMRRVFSSSLFFSFGTTATDADASRLHAGALERAPQALAGGVDAPLSQELLSCLHTLSPNETELARLLRDSTDGKGQATTTTATTTLPPTESDAEVEAAARLLLSRSPPSLSAVLVKRGGKGSMLVERIEGEGGGGQASAASASSSSSSSSVRVFAQPAARVASVVDTTGAGDCFTAAYCVAWLRELGGGRGKEKNSEEEKDAEEEKREKVQQRLRFATAAAALCVTRAGALPSMPSQVEVERFLEGGGGFS